MDVGLDNDDADCAALHAYRRGYLDLKFVVCNGAHRARRGVRPGQEMEDRARLTLELCHRVLHGTGKPILPIYPCATSAVQGEHFGAWATVSGSRTRGARHAQVDRAAARARHASKWRSTPR